jgi:Asp-tRNA(Asn)/Glu-tRNA(Gln) amidotransferase A subunit family amidase
MTFIFSYAIKELATMISNQRQQNDERLDHLYQRIDKLERELNAFRQSSVKEEEQQAKLNETLDELIKSNYDII